VLIVSHYLLAISCKTSSSAVAKRPRDASCLSAVSFNTTLVGLPAYQIDRLQSVLNAADRLVYSSRRYDHVTPLLRELQHWLRMSQLIDYKLAVLVYRCLNGLALSYLANDLQCAADLDARRCLRSASTSTGRACDAPVNSRRPCVSGGRGSRVEQSAGRCHFVAIAVDIQETAEDRTVCSELSIARAASDTHCFFTARTSFRFLSFLFVRCPSSL